MTQRSVELEVTELGYSELQQLTERMVRLNAAHNLGDVIRLIYEAGFHRLKAAVELEESRQKSGGGIVLPH